MILRPSQQVDNSRHISAELSRPAVTLLLLLFKIIGPVSAGSVSGGTVALLSWRWNRLLLMVVAFSSPYEDLRGGLCPRAYLHVVGMLRFMFLYKPTECAHSFLFCSSVYFFLYDPFNWVSFHKFSRQFAAFSLCSSGLLSALSVLSTVFLFVKIFFSPDIILLWLTWLKTPTN